MNFKYKLLCTLFLSVWSVAAMAQNEVISGTVSDADSGEPLPGVNIVLQGTSTGTTTGVDGTYELTVPSLNETLLYSYIGYQNQVVPINGRTSIDIALQQEAVLGDELVVVGYGTQKSKDLTTSVSQISADKIENRPIARVDKALIGQSAGVRVQEISGKPGQALDIQIRGTSTITAGTDPLYVVDGVPISGGLDNVAVGNIESIEILKDAASASIYGSRGANGVVIITTKKGRTSEPMVSIKTQMGFQQMAGGYDVLNRDEWIDYAIENRTQTYAYNGGDTSLPYDQWDTHPAWKINPEWMSNPESFSDTDWFDLITRTAPIHNTQLSISGRSGKTGYSFYGDVFQEEGILIHTGYDRYSFRANIDSQVNDKFTFGINISPSYSISRDSDADNRGGPIARAKFLAPIVDPECCTVELPHDSWTRSDILVNPVYWLREVDDQTKRFRVIGDIYGEYEITEGLGLKNMFAVDYTNSNNNLFHPNNVNRGRGSFAQAATGLGTNILNETTLNYLVDIGPHSITALAGFSAQKFHSESTFTEARGFPDDLVQTLNAGTELTAGSSFMSEHSLLSYLARATYNYDDRYLFTASIRRDGSSRFGENNRWGLFPSGSIGWRVSDESFMSGISEINELKFRVSYGVSGNYNIPNYGHIGSISQSNYVFGAGAGSLVAGLSPSSFSNPDLSWEKNYTLNFGMDLGLLDNRFTLGIDVYRSITKDLLLDVPIPAISGFQNTLENIGEVENGGIEVELGARVLSTSDFTWTIDGNLTHNQNEVLALGRSGVPIPGFGRGTLLTITQIGEPIGSYYLIPVEGVFMSEEELNNSALSGHQEVGDLKYKDVNGDGVITNDDRTIVGQNQPDITWGISQQIQYKNFDLSAFVYGEWGDDFYLVNASQGGAGRSYVGNVLGYWRNRWRSPEDPGNGKVPRAATTENLTTPSTFWLFNANFWRLRNVTLGYTLPNSLLEKIGGLRSVRVYASGENLFTKDHYYGISQTGASSNSPTAPGMEDTNTYPMSRSIVFGVNINF